MKNDTKFRASVNKTPFLKISNVMLLNELIKDEKKIDKTLYSSGPYWDYKNSRAILEIKKKVSQILEEQPPGLEPLLLTTWF